jgi:hypothetical protein
MNWNINSNIIPALQLEETACRAKHRKQIFSIDINLIILLIIEYIDTW